MRQRGFTLVELMVSLLAGLIVALGVVGIAKEATNTFHEEMRVAAAEMGLRIAVERLRSDLQRAAYMGTGNIVGDNMNLGLGGTVAVCPGTVRTNAAFVGVPGASALAGIQLQFGGSTAATPLSSDPTNGLNPDALNLAGNFTGGEEYSGYLGQAPTGDSGTCSAGASVFNLYLNNPPGWRLVNGPSPPGALMAAFHPGNPNLPSGNGAFATTAYMVRLADSQGHTQYAATCAGPNAIFYSAGPPAVAAINLDLNATPLATSACQAQWVPGTGAGNVRIAPLQWVHWDLRPAAGLPTNYNYGATATTDAKNYVLTRQLVDAHTLPSNVISTGANPIVDPSTLEVVAEYAVDLKFAFSVDPNNPFSPPGAYGAGAQPLTHLDLDNPASASWASDVTASPSPPAAPFFGPQRIRSVRMRIATRTAAPDRSDNPPPVPNPTSAAGLYKFRYCVSPPCAPGTVTWSRVRTVITEVALPNQARLYY